MATEVARARAVAVSPRGQPPDALRAAVGVEERSACLGAEIDLDVLVAGAPLSDEGQDGLSSIRIEIGQLVWAVRRGGDAGLAAVGDHESGRASISLPRHAADAVDPPAAVDRHILFDEFVDNDPDWNAAQLLCAR